MEMEGLVDDATAERWLMAKLHVLLKKEELDRERLPGKTVIVLDVALRDLEHRDACSRTAPPEVLPLLDRHGGAAEAARRVPGSFVLSGELDATTLEGFCHPTPLALLREDLVGQAAHLLHDQRDGGARQGARRGARGRGGAPERERGGGAVPREPSRPRPCSSSAPALPIASTWRTSTAPDISSRASSPAARNVTS